MSPLRFAGENLRRGALEPGAFHRYASYLAFEQRTVHTIHSKG